MYTYNIYYMFSCIYKEIKSKENGLHEYLPDYLSIHIFRL